LREGKTAVQEDGQVQKRMYFRADEVQFWFSWPK